MLGGLLYVCALATGTAAGAMLGYALTVVLAHRAITALVRRNEPAPA